MSSANAEVKEYKVIYNTDDDIRSYDFVTFEGSKTGDPYVTYQNVNRAVRWGSFVINIDEEIPGPVYLQYILDGFYQNHMWYMRSVDEDQMRYPYGVHLLILLFWIK